MTHPAPIRARSRTWAWFHMLVPGPMIASADTSADGWMRTDGRWSMRPPWSRPILLSASGTGEPRGPFPSSTPQGALQEGGHLLTGHQAARAESARGAAAGDAGGGEAIDVGLVDGGLVIGEEVGARGRQPQRAHEEGGHLLTGYRLGGAEAVGGAAGGDPRLGQPC